MLPNVINQKLVERIVTYSSVEICMVGHYGLVRAANTRNIDVNKYHLLRTCNQSELDIYRSVPTKIIFERSPSKFLFQNKFSLSFKKA
jgi:hypothetical protein